MKAVMTCAFVLLAVATVQAQPTTGFELKNLAGNPRPYSPDLVRDIKKPVVIYFWGTWHADHAEGLARFVNASREYPDVVVVAVAISSNPERLSILTEALDRVFPTHHVQWSYRPLGFDPRELEQFDLRAGVANTVLIDRNARLVRRHSGDIDWKSRRVRAIMRDLIGKK